MSTESSTPSGTINGEQVTKVKFRLVTVRRGYPISAAGEFTRSQFDDLRAALKALGPHKQAFGSVGSFNPRHPSATEYELVAVSIQDSSKAVVSSYEDSLKAQTLAAWVICANAASDGVHDFVLLYPDRPEDLTNRHLCKHCRLPRTKVEGYAERAKKKLRT